MSELLIRTVRTPSDRNIFIKLLWKLYAGDPNWVPPLLMDRRKLIDTKKNPFYEHADAEFYIAERNGEVLGRIAAIVNHNHIKEHKEKVGFFGFFECVNDKVVAHKLFDSAASFLKSKGMSEMRGPANPSVNDEYGLLVDGFDKPPVVLMPYNPPYYSELIESYGLRKIKDLYAFILHNKLALNEKMIRVNSALKERGKLIIRPINMKSFNKELELVKHIYNTAWQKNWGEIPLTDKEVDALADDLKPIINPNLVLFAEKEGKTIGFALTIPDINQVLIRNKRGWLLPGLFRLLTQKKKINMVRVIVLGVLPEYLKTGAASLLFYETAMRAEKEGYLIGEASWILEDNEPMIRAAKTMKGDPYKKYRIYQMSLNNQRPLQSL